jgi:CheY-like chemotaxis protein
MAAEQLEAIFQPFEQVGESHRRAGGTGLGLAISRQLVRLMGSDIHVDSQVGCGSRFWFEITLPHAEAAVSGPLSASTITGYQGARRKVLIVDDVVGNRALLSDLLGELGFDLDEATNGAEALSRAATAKPDLVLMDLVMPVMDGMEAIRRIRATPELAGLQIIAVSASANHIDQEAARAVGANHFLAKPLDEDKLLNLIGATLNLAWSYTQPLAPEAAGTGALVTPPPAAELATLHELALAGDMRGIRGKAAELAERTPIYAAFAEHLQNLALGYQSKAILNLLTTLMNNKEQAS